MTQVKLDPNKIYSYREFHDLFSDDLACRNYLESIRWGEMIQCAHCESPNITRFANNNKIFKCKDCRKKFSVTVGTIFQGTQAPLPIWFYLIYMSAINKKNISSRQMCLNIGLTQKNHMANDDEN